MKQEVVKLKDIALFDRLRPQLSALLDELKELSKKKADAAISKFKLKLVNEKLAESNGLLGSGNKPFKDFDLLDVDNVPTTSDAVIVLSQYLEALETWRSARVFFNEEDREWYWNNTEESSWVRAKPPRRSQIIEANKEDETDDEEE